MHFCVVFNYNRCCEDCALKSLDDELLGYIECEYVCQHDHDDPYGCAGECEEQKEIKNDVLH